MPRKGGAELDEEPLGKGSKARAQKAASASAKESNERKKAEAEEDEKWSEGINKRGAAKKAQEEEKKREAELRRAAIADQLKAEEEAAGKAKKLRGAEKVAVRKTQEAAAASHERDHLAAPSLEGRGIDAALAVLTIATHTGSGGAAGGAGGSASDDHAADTSAALALAASIANPSIKVEDSHPEKRLKAAFRRFEEKELAALKEEFPTLRRSQLNDMVWRKWARSSENPAVVAAREAAGASAGSSWKD